MKLPPDHYKGPHATSKGHAPLLIPVPPWEIVNKPMNMDSAIMLPDSLVIHESKSAQLVVQGSPIP